MREVVRSLWLGRLSYLLLGPLEVREGDSDVELRGGQQRKLLAILLLHGGEAVSTDLLIEELWDGKPPETAVKALQGYVSSLRKQLGQETVGTVGAGYRLNVVPEDTDAGQFEELLAEARLLERVPAAAKLREALGLWRGPALVDFAYNDFARHEIDRLDELRLTAVERRIDLELALGHHDDLVPELEALVSSYPLREHVRGQLMVALYRSGRQAEALDEYREAHTVLRDELGLEPSEDLQALQRAILDHDPALAAPPRADLPARHATVGGANGSCVVPCWRWPLGSRFSAAQPPRFCSRSEPARRRRSYPRTTWQGSILQARESRATRVSGEIRLRSRSAWPASGWRTPRTAR